MTERDHIDDRLSRLGDRLEAAARADLPQAVAAPRNRRRIAIFAAAAALLAPPAAIAANALLSPEEVAKGLPAGTSALIGTDPTCEEVKEGEEYRCTLAKVPALEYTQPDPDMDPKYNGRKSEVAFTVNADKVNGACLSLNEDGKTWQCYIGKRARQRHLISANMLGSPVERFAHPRTTAEEVADGLGRRKGIEGGSDPALEGTDPTCERTEDGRAWDCRLAKAPDLSRSGEAGTLGPNEMKGWVNLINNRDENIVGGCTATSADGRRWRCYMGTEAIGKGIMIGSLLGDG